MTASKRLLLHAGYWALYLALLAFMLAIVRLQALPILFASRVGLLLVAPNVLAFYFAYLWVFPGFAARKIAAAFAVAVAAPLAFLFVLPAPAEGRAMMSACLTALAAVQMIIAVVLRGFIAWADELPVKEELRTELIRARLDPHFLFNTLNNIDVLILRDPQVASAYLNKLSEILRFVLYEARSERIPLRAELDSLEKYLDLQRIRLSNPKSLSTNISGDSQALSIAPMLLIPFVENAFKHAAGQRGDDAIQVRIVIDRGRLEFACSNRYGERTASASGGVGNELMRRRLALLYPDRHELEIAENSGSHTVRLQIDLNDPALPHR